MIKEEIFELWCGTEKLEGMLDYDVLVSVECKKVSGHMKEWFVV